MLSLKASHTTKTSVPPLSILYLRIKGPYFPHISQRLVQCFWFLSDLLASYFHSLDSCINRDAVSGSCFNTLDILLFPVGCKDHHCRVIGKFVWCQGQNWDWRCWYCWSNFTAMQWNCCWLFMNWIVAPSPVPSVYCSSTEPRCKVCCTYMKLHKCSYCFHFDCLWEENPGVCSDSCANI